MQAKYNMLSRRIAVALLAAPCVLAALTHTCPHCLRAPMPFEDKSAYVHYEAPVEVRAQPSIARGATMLLIRNVAIVCLPPSLLLLIFLIAQRELASRLGAKRLLSSAHGWLRLAAGTLIDASALSSDPVAVMVASPSRSSPCFTHRDARILVQLDDGALLFAPRPLFAWCAVERARARFDRQSSLAHFQKWMLGDKCVQNPVRIVQALPWLRNRTAGRAPLELAVYSLKHGDRVTCVIRDGSVCAIGASPLAAARVACDADEVTASALTLLTIVAIACASHCNVMQTNQ